MNKTKEIPQSGAITEGNVRMLEDMAKSELIFIEPRGSDEAYAETMEEVTKMMKKSGRGQDFMLLDFSKQRRKKTKALNPYTIRTKNNRIAVKSKVSKTKGTRRWGMILRYGVKLTPEMVKLMDEVAKLARGPYKAQHYFGLDEPFLSTASTADLENMSEENAAAILENTSTKLFLKKDQ